MKYSVLVDIHRDFIRNQWIDPIINPNDSGRLQAECELERDSLLTVCKRARHCHPLQLREALRDMCHSGVGDLQEMSARAAEQFACIFGVAFMCIALYVALCVLEKSVTAVVGKKDKSAIDLYDLGGKKSKVYREYS